MKTKTKSIKLTHLRGTPCSEYVNCSWDVADAEFVTCKKCTKIANAEGYKTAIN